MKRLIIAILLISSVVALASQPFVLEPIVPKKYQMTWDQEKNEYIEIPIADYLQIQRNFDKIARKIRETEYRADSNFVQRGIDTTNANGYDTVYLADKYETLNAYSALSSQSVFTVVHVQKLSDSSFILISTDPDAGWTAAPFAICRWFTIGLLKK